jgi:hypothetical protein
MQDFDMLLSGRVEIDALKGQPHFSDFVKEAPELWLRCNAHGSIGHQKR